MVWTFAQASRWPPASPSGIAPRKAVRRRHRFLQGAGRLPVPLRGLVDAAETYLLYSRKLDRPPRLRDDNPSQRGLSDDQVPVLTAIARGGPTLSAVLERVSESGLHAALRPLVARDAVLVSVGGPAYSGCTRALVLSYEAVNLSAGQRVWGSYLRWLQQVDLLGQPSLRDCLAAAVVTPWIRLAN